MTIAAAAEKEAGARKNAAYWNRRCLRLRRRSRQLFVVFVVVVFTAVVVVFVVSSFAVALGNPFWILVLVTHHLQKKFHKCSKSFFSKCFKSISHPSSTNIISLQQNSSSKEEEYYEELRDIIIIDITAAIDGRSISLILLLHCRIFFL